jgi:hypothetical protein
MPAIFDLEPALNPVLFETLRDHMNPDDFSALEQARAEAVQTGSPGSAQP